MPSAANAQRVRSSRNRRRLDLPGPYDVFTLAPGLVEPGSVPLPDALALVAVAWRSTSVPVGFSDATLDRYLYNLRRFVEYATACDVRLLSGCTAELCADFVHAMPSGGLKSTNRSGAPAYGTQASKRTSLSNFFATCHRLGLWAENPAGQVATHGTSVRRTRPLTPEEVARCMDRAAFRAREHRHPAVLALALAGATVTEIPRVRVSNVDLGNRLVWLPGLGVRYRERWVPLDDWQHRALSDRISAISRHLSDIPLADRSVTYNGDPLTHKTMRVAFNTNAALWRIFTKAGLTREDGIRPASVLEFVVNRVYAETGHIEAAAVRCGLRSLDVTAALLDQDWATRWAIQPPAAVAIVRSAG